MDDDVMPTLVKREESSSESDDGDEAMQPSITSLHAAYKLGQPHMMHRKAHTLSLSPTKPPPVTRDKSASLKLSLPPVPSTGGSNNSNNKEMKLTLIPTDTFEEEDSNDDDV